MGLPVNVKVIRKNGRQIVRIHWFVRDAKGPIRNGSIVVDKSKMITELGGGVGYIACQPKLATLKTPIVNGALVPVCCSPEIGAVTCPECMATVEYRKTKEALLPKRLVDPEKHPHAIQRVYVNKEVT